MICIEAAHSKDAKLIETIAGPIWQQHYSNIIGREQVDYMLAKFQSESAISTQIQSGIEYFLIYENQMACGYMALQAKPEVLFISKFYLNEQSRGKGIGRLMLDKARSVARLKRLSRLELTVNKENPALAAYLKLGFEILGAVKIDIGNGFVMDDYRMQQRL